MSDAELEAVPTTHEARPIDMAWGARIRRPCWESLEDRVRTRLLQNAGTVIDWWASDGPDGRPSAVVLGERELCFADPVFIDDRPVYLVTGYMLDPASIRRFGGRPGPKPVDDPVRQVAPPGTRLVDIGLEDDVRGVLGNLPAHVQDALQAPFTSGRRVERYGWYGEGDERHLDVFVVFLAGPHAVTAATGALLHHSGHTGTTTQWTLTCHQAAVVGRRGL